LDDGNLDHVGKGYFDVHDYYSVEKKIMPDESVFWPVTGGLTRPATIVYR
jgi:hypothetical protein